MRVALISDIHANLMALKTVLDEVAQDEVDQVVCLGDVANLGPQPKESLELIRERGIPCVMGNHDSFMLEPDLVHTYTDQPLIARAVDWSHARLDPDDLAYLRTFPQTMELALDDGVKMLLFHGSPRSNMDDILALTPPEEIDQMLAGHEAAVMACGHTHIQMLRQHKGRLLINPGSVGCPFLEYVAGGPPTVMAYAEYAVVECVQGALKVSLSRIPLDREELYQAVEQSDFPLRGMMLQQYS